jgi:DNA-binding NtrC family response regulator
MAHPRKEVEANGPAAASPPSAADPNLAARGILLVEDEETARNKLQHLLQIDPALRVESVKDGDQALQRLLENNYSVLITDLRMPRLDGMQLLKEVQRRGLPVTVIVMTGHGSIDEAVQAIRMGAYDFLTKPIDVENLRLVLQRALRDRALQDEVAMLRAQLQSRFQFHNVLSKNPRMHAAFELIANVAHTTTTVLIEGETCTGKEQVARAIHQASVGRTGPMVAVNCAALPENLLESELFGHEKGAFTSAISSRKGRFELADGGTLFLDEVGDMPPAMQAKVLRVLQEGEFERVGGQQTLRCDVRVVAATNKDIAAEVEGGRFREDLYYRLNVVPVHTPALREHKEDLPELCARFLAEFCERNGRRPMQLAREALLTLQAHDWPGNVRELRNQVERLVILCDGPEISAADVARVLPGARKPRTDRLRPGAGFHELVEDAEREIILSALDQNQGNVSDTARALGLERSHLYKKMRALGVKRGTE